jgi:YidC/Oxa1 family membrane protein insertase
LTGLFAACKILRKEVFVPMFTTLIVQPIFNLLVLIYAILPGHNFGLAIILFTIIVRLLMWPLVKKQLRHARAMRELQPELKKIKAAAKGDRQKESQLTMELYKEKEINPFASIGIILVQIPIFISLYGGLNRILHDPHQIISFSYPTLHDLGWLQTLSHDIHKFDSTLFGVVDLTKPALGKNGLYFPALVIVIASAATQYLQSKQLMPKNEDSRSLRQILKDAGKGGNADQSEVQQAVGSSTLFIIPLVVFFVSLGLAAALPLYWFVSSTVAYFQQAKILEEDAAEADKSVDKPATKVMRLTEEEANKLPRNKKTKKISQNARNKRRKR